METYSPALISAIDALQDPSRSDEAVFAHVAGYMNYAAISDPQVALSQAQDLLEQALREASNPDVDELTIRTIDPKYTESLLTAIAPLVRPGAATKQQLRYLLWTVQATAAARDLASSSV